MRTTEREYGLDALPPAARAFLDVPLPQAQEGFEAFWRATYAQARQIPLRLERREIASPSARHRLYEFECDSFGGVRIGGWITEPADGTWQRGVVVGHGYGGRGEPAFDFAGPPAVTIQPCMRGFNRSRSGAIPGDSKYHVLCGIATRDGYVIRGCVGDVWAAASVLLAGYPELAGALHYDGGSFGGGLGALALAWDSRFVRALLDVPTFGNHIERLKIPCAGSGEPVRLLAQKRPEVRDVVAWYDAAIAAQWVRIPVLVAAALEDPAVTPVGQFAVFKGLGGEKRLFIRKTGHPNTAEDDAALNQALAGWWGGRI